MEKIDQILESLYDRVIEPMEAKEQLLLLSDEKCDEVISALDEYARDFSPREYGLPTHAMKHIVHMRTIIKAQLNGL